MFFINLLLILCFVTRWFHADRSVGLVKRNICCRCNFLSETFRVTQTHAWPRRWTAGTRRGLRARPGVDRGAPPNRHPTPHARPAAPRSTTVTSSAATSTWRPSQRSRPCNEPVSVSCRPRHLFVSMCRRSRVSLCLEEMWHL